MSKIRSRCCIFQFTPARSRRHYATRNATRHLEFQSTPARSRRLIPTSILVWQHRFQSTPARSRRPSDRCYYIGTNLFQSTPARSRRQQLLPIFIYIPHISLYKSTNILYSPPIPPPIPLSKCAFSSANPLRN